MLDSGGKSRVYNHFLGAIITILARLRAPWLWGMLKTGLFRGSLPTTSSYRRGSRKFLGQV